MILFGYKHQIHLLPESALEHCFSELEFLRCNTSVDNVVLFGLTKMLKSIKELDIIVEEYNSNDNKKFLLYLF